VCRGNNVGAIRRDEVAVSDAVCLCIPYPQGTDFIGNNVGVVRRDVDAVGDVDGPGCLRWSCVVGDSQQAFPRNSPTWSFLQENFLDDTLL